MNVLAIDIGGTHVKILASGQNERQEFESGPKMTPQSMVANVKRLAKDWKYELVSIGYPGRVRLIDRSPSHVTLQRAGSVSITKPPSIVPSGSSMMPPCRRWEATAVARCFF